MAGMGGLGNPLTNRDLAELNKAMFICNQLLEKLDQAERAGLDVTDIRNQRDEVYQQAASIKAAYFPQDE